MQKPNLTFLLIFYLSYIATGSVITGPVIVDQNWDDYGTYPTTVTDSGPTIDNVTYKAPQGLTGHTGSDAAG